MQKKSEEITEETKQQQITILEDLKKHATYRSDLHDRSSLYYRRLFYMIQFITIIITSITGTLSIDNGSTTISNEKATKYLVVIGSIQIVVSILNGFLTIFRPGEYFRRHKMMEIMYSKIKWDIYSEFPFLGTDQRTYRDISEFTKAKLSWIYQLRYIEPPIPDIITMPLWRIMLCMFNDKYQNETKKNLEYEDELAELGKKAGIGENA